MVWLLRELCAFPRLLSVSPSVSGSLRLGPDDRDFCAGYPPPRQRVRSASSVIARARVLARTRACMLRQ